VATAIGAVACPNLREALAGLAERLALPALAGPFLLAALAYIIAGTILIAKLRPDPFLVARHLEQQHLDMPSSDATEKLVEYSTKPSRMVRVGALVLVVSQIVMVGIMTMTPIHMRAHDHSMGAVDRKGA